ncbi:MAG: radical SAM protein [Candidatus Riflebacteria bacterium]|nr:radical SAM protein [Candidatus Riflebacteria bacterium]
MSFPLKILTHQILGAIGKKTFHYPFGIYVYLTFSCNLRCSYCDGGTGQKFPEMEKSELSSKEWENIFRKMVRHSDVLMLSGGEPLLHKEFSEIVRCARKVGFTFISLNTNGLLLTPQIAASVDAIIISLDSLDREKSDRIWNRQGATEKVLETIQKIAPMGHPSLMINSVILPENIKDVSKVLEFCGKNNIAFSAGPALLKTKLHPSLKGNTDYHNLIDQILEAKKKGKRVAATIDYLKGLKREAKFDCQPVLVWRIYPNGDIVFPCSRLNKTIGNALEWPDPIDAFRKHCDGNFFQLDCKESCPLSCYMDVSFMIKRPLSLIREGLFRIKTFSSGHRMMY